MKKAKISLVWLLCLALCAAMLGGCVSTGGGSSTAAGSGSQPAAGSYTEGDEVTLRIVDWSDSALSYREAFHKKFEENHPGVTIEYTCLTIDEFNSSIVNMIISGDGPDLFPIPTGLSLPIVQKEDWYMPLDDYIFDEFMATLKQDMFMEGITHLDGKLYVIPEQMPFTNTLMYYNQDVLDAAGIIELPTTYSEFIDACAQITAAGNGEYYGFVDGGSQTNRLDALLRGLTGMAGGKISVSSNFALTVDGRAPYDSEAVYSAFDFLTELYAAGSVHPDTLNINAPVAREYFAKGQAAFLCQGLWCIGSWAATDPDLNYGVMALPMPDGTTGGKVQKNQVAGWMGAYSQTQYPELCAEYLECMYDPEYGYQQDLVQSGAYLSIVEGLNEENMVSEQMEQYYAIGNEVSVSVPSATLRDSDAYGFYAEVVDVEPSMAAILQGVWSGSIADYKAELTKLSDATTAEWQRACEAIGLDYGVFEFDNWQAGVDYTEEDYAALK